MRAKGWTEISMAELRRRIFWRALVKHYVPEPGPFAQLAEHYRVFGAAPRRQFYVGQDWARGGSTVIAEGPPKSEGYPITVKRVAIRRGLKPNITIIDDID